MKKNQHSIVSGTDKNVLAMAHTETQKLLHELEVHQVELEQSNEALRISRDETEVLLKKYSELYDFAPVGYFAVDRQGMIVECNLTFTMQIGTERSKLLRHSFIPFIAEGSRQPFRVFIEKVFAGDSKVSCETEFRLNGDTVMVVRIDGLIHPSGQFCSMVMTDITEQRTLEETKLFLASAGWASAEEDFFCSLARFLSRTLRMDFVCIDELLEDGLEAKTVAVFHDGSFEDNVRYTLKETPCGEVVGKNICCFPKGVCDLFPSDVVLRDMAAESYAGTTLWDPEGHPIGLIALAGRRQIENVRLYEIILNLVSYRAAGELERRKAQAELRIAKEKAERSDKLKSTFLANMSHEIRTPMNSIVGFSRLISKPGISPEESIRFADIVQSRSEDLMHIIDDLLEISRIESGNSIVSKEKVCVNTVLDETEIIFREKIGKADKKDVVLLKELKLSDEQATIVTDGYILQHVLTNLIDNAIKFTREGSVRFGYSLPEEGMISFFVEDTGIGISAENQKIIFEHFRQAEISNPHQYGGTGLGLAICRGSLALIDGDISVWSDLGKGSRFIFRIPYIQDHTIRETADKKVPVQTERKKGDWVGKKILIVEDDQANMEYLLAVLKPKAAELILAYSGTESRARFKDLHEVDVVLLDIRLPDASGWDLAKELKAIRPNLPIIAQTANAMPSDQIKSQEAGCDAYISKPINRNSLIEILAGYLE